MKMLASNRIKTRSKKIRTGMRSIRILLPDFKSQAMMAELRRQSILVSSTPDETEVMVFLKDVGADWVF